MWRDLSGIAALLTVFEDCLGSEHLLYENPEKEFYQISNIRHCPPFRDSQNCYLRSSLEQRKQNHGRLLRRTYRKTEYGDLTLEDVGCTDGRET